MGEVFNILIIYKVVIVDGRISSIGSANFDDRTAYFNFDANVMFHSERTVKRTKDMFLSDLKECRPFDPSGYSGVISSFKILICSIVRPLA